MSLQTIIVSAIAFITIGYLAIVSVPIVFTVGYQVPLWQNASAQALLARDNIFNTWELWIPALFFATIIWAIRRSARRDDDDS